MRDDKGKNDKNSDSSLVASPVQGHEYSPKNNENLSSREIVYEYIRKQMKEGNLLPGSVLDLKAISHKLGTSRQKHSLLWNNTCRLYVWRDTLCALSDKGRD